MVAIYRGLRWEKGTARVFKGADKYGGNFVATTPAKLYITLLAVDGRLIIKDIANTVRYVNDWKNFSDKRFASIKKRLESIHQFQIDENGDIINLEEIVLL